MLTFEQAVLRLQRYWGEQGCLLWQPMNTEVGAGTMNPATFLRVLGPAPWKVAYVEPSVRPDDSRYGDNPNRMQTHTQFQVILKPDTGRPTEQYLSSLAALGIDIAANDVRFVEDNWESPALGAWGLGWEVWLNGLEITQFTYFQQAGGLTLEPVSVEITYGLERILMALQGVSHFKDIEYAPGVSYGELFGRSEYELSVFYLDAADVARTRHLFELHEEEARAMLDRGLVLPAYVNVLRTSHLFNVLDARGAVGVTERAAFFARMRDLSRRCARLWIDSDEEAHAPSPAPVADRASTTAVPAPEAAAFVLEVGTEELPTTDVEDALTALGAEVPAALERLRLDFGDVDVQATPRRLTVTVSGLATRQRDERRVVLGPPSATAWSDDGTPTKAAEGFARKHGLSAADLSRELRDRREFAAATVEERGLPATDVLGAALADLLGRIPFRRAMRWNASGVAFSRPIRWILALLGDAVVPLSFAGVESGRATRGLRFADDESLEVPDASAYAQTLAAARVQLDRDRRRAEILTGAREAATAAGGQLPPGADGPLLAEVADLVERPTVLRARFDERFLTLPPEVLTTVMIKHQRYFPVVAGERVLASFVAVANGDIDADVVRAGNEAVIRARFSDAEFFYAQDLGQPFEGLRERLATLAFHERLGSMLDKAARIERLSVRLSADVELATETADVVARAGHLAKNDLASAMVVEFTSLAGIMGGYYAAHAGESPEVAHAIREHVRPTSASDEPPRDLAGALIGLADRIDSLVGLFAVDVKPTGSADPYALRRAAYAVVQTLVGHELDLDLGAAVDAAAELQPVPVAAETRAEVLAFVWRRMEVWLRESGYAHDVVQAAIAGADASLTRKLRRAQELAALTGEERFRRVHAAYVRAANIAARAPADARVDEALFESEHESALWDAYRAVGAGAEVSASLPGFVAAFERLAGPIDEFFDNVFVMADDERVASNRLSMLAAIAALPRALADLTLLRESVEEPARPVAS